jgi:hypothetical protein
MDIKDIPTLLNEEKESLVHFNNIDGSQIIDTFRDLPKLSQLPLNERVKELINHYKNNLRKLRFGREIPSPHPLGVIPSIEDITENRREFGGYIDIRSGEYVVTNMGIHGTIKDFSLMLNKVNVHTHPPYNGKWPFAPPSEIDISYLIQEQRGKGETIYNAVATREGMYIYYLHKKFNIAPEHEMDFDLEYRELKNSLGYNSSNGTELFGGTGGFNYNSPDISKIKTTNMIINSQSITQPTISIGTFLNKVNSIGICMHLIPYDDELVGGSKIYPISYSL